jgi:hypothetical protein
MTGRGLLHLLQLSLHDQLTLPHDPQSQSFPFVSRSKPRPSLPPRAKLPLPWPRPIVSPPRPEKIVFILLLEKST